MEFYINEIGKQMFLFPRKDLACPECGSNEWQRNVVVEGNKLHATCYVCKHTETWTREYDERFEAGEV